MLVDVHAHLTFKDFDKDIDEVIKRAEQAGFYAIICNGTNAEQNRKVLTYTDKYPLVKPALGIYPSDGVEMSDEDFDLELEFIESVKPFAIGEVGIDYFRVENPERQKKNFLKFIRLAKKLNIPIIVHSRKAELDAIQLLEQEGAKRVVMHCFSGNKELTERVMANGWMVSTPGAVTRRKEFRKVARWANSEQLLTETDAPFLSPFNEKPRSESSYIKDSIKEIAKLKDLDEKDMEGQILKNFKRMFEDG